MNRIGLLGASLIALVAPLSACASHKCCCCKDKEGEREVAVAINDLPPAVRAGLERESAGGKLTEIEKEMRHGKTVYSADAEVNGVEWDITVGEDGALISKEREDAGEEEEHEHKH